MSNVLFYESPDVAAFTSTRRRHPNGFSRPQQCVRKINSTLSTEGTYAVDGNGEVKSAITHPGYIAHAACTVGKQSIPRYGTSIDAIKVRS